MDVELPRGQHPLALSYPVHALGSLAALIFLPATLEGVLTLL